MRRREVMAALLAGALSARRTAYAEQNVLRRIGVLMGPPEGDAEGEARVAGLRRGLHAAGWMEGQNLHIAYRWGASEGDIAMMRAADLLAQRPEVIAVNTPAGLAALKKLTSTTPLVFVQYISEGFVESLARPGGNVTGFTMLQERLDEKWLEIIREIAPQTRRVAFMQTGPSCLRPRGSTW
jgi:putative ABC transport system substrate-binding protein